MPAAQKPEYTEGYEGFIHLTDMEGTVEKSTLRYIIRDHDAEKFRQKKERMSEAAAYLNAKYGAGTVNITIRDSYFNMRQVIEPNMFVVDRAKKALEDAKRKYVGQNPNILALPLTFKTTAVHLCMKDPAENSHYRDNTPSHPCGC